MKFCQVDGTPLVDEAPAFDPYATIVAPAGIAVPPVEETPAEAAPASVDESEAATQIAPFPEDAPISEPADVLDLPSESDPLKTMYVSEDELKQAMESGGSGDENLIEMPAAAPEPPSFIESASVAPPSPFDAPPPSPMSDQAAIPSPFASDEQVVEIAPEPAVPPTIVAEAAPPSPVFEQPAAAAPIEWAPPPAPEQAWQNTPIGSETPFAPPVAGGAGQNKTLAIISLVCGILSLICCSWFIPGIAAIILGFIARGKANSDPQNYGGAGLALGGIITGGISLILGVIVIILYFAGALASGGFRF